MFRGPAPRAPQRRRWANVPRQRRSPGMVSPSAVFSGLEQGYACRESGRHPTDARKVVPNPRRAAGSPVVCYWLRLCQCTEVKKYHEDLKIRCQLLTLEVIATPGVSCCRKRKRCRSRRWRQSAPGLAFGMASTSTVESLLEFESVFPSSGKFLLLYSHMRRISH
jgi:hypothetical protein